MVEATPRSRVGWVVLLSVLGGLFVLTVVDAHNTRYATKVSDAYIDWTAANRPWSLALYIATTTLAILCTLPLSVFVAAAGPLFVGVYGYAEGIMLSALAMTIADVLAGLVALLVGRFLLRESMQNILATDHRFRLVRAVDRLMATQGVELTITVKVAPVPSGTLSYILGCTPVSTTHFVLGSFVAAAPYCALACFFAASAVHWRVFLDAFFKSRARAVAFAVVVVLVFAALTAVTWRLKERYSELLVLLDQEDAQTNLELATLTKVQSAT
jgi:uncharacterized membrane protein YdjX (TVP38/TMEM64 family)